MLTKAAPPSPLPSHQCASSVRSCRLTKSQRSREAELVVNSCRGGGTWGKPKYPCPHAGNACCLIGDGANHWSPKENTTVIIIPWGLHSHICGWSGCGVAYVLLVRRAAGCCCCCYCCAAALTWLSVVVIASPIHAGPTSELRTVSEPECRSD